MTKNYILNYKHRNVVFQVIDYQRCSFVVDVVGKKRPYFFDFAKMATVKLKVTSKMHEDFLRWRYPPDESGSLAVRSDILGRLLVAHCRISDRPVASSEGSLTFVLPKGDAVKNLENKWLYYNAGDIVALNMAIAAVFDLDFSGYYRKGECLGIQKKDIVQSYIISRKLFSADNFDALHKRAYRKSQAALGSMTERLLRKLYYIDESIDFKALQDYDKNH